MTRARVDSTIRIITVVAAIVVNVHQCRAETISLWNGSTGDWNDPTRWSTNPFFPNNGNGAPDYAATIGGGTVNLNTNVVLSSLIMNGGVLNGSGNLTAAQLTLNNGLLSTTGAINATQANLMGGTLGRDLTLAATAGNTVKGVAIGAGKTLTVPVGSTLTTNAGLVETGVGGTGLLQNEGTFISNGVFRYYMDALMNNLGSVEVQQGNFRMTNAGTHTGTFEVASGQLELAGTQVLQSTADVFGPGGLLIISGTSTIDSAVTTNFLRLVGGTLKGSGNLSPDHFIFEQGILDRDLTLPTTTGNTIAGTNIAAGRTLTVPVGSTLTAAANAGESGVGGPGMVVNEGTLINNGIFRFYMDAPMNNLGNVEVQQGNFRMTNSGTHTGTFQVTNGQLELAGTQVLQSTAAVTGAGGLLIINGTSTIDCEVSTNFLRLVGGTLTGSGDLHPDHFILEQGTIGRDLTLPTTIGNTISGTNIAATKTLTVPVGSTLTAITPAGETGVGGTGVLQNEGTLIKNGNFRFYMDAPMNNLGNVEVQQGNFRMTNAGMHTGTFEVAAGQLELAGTQVLQSPANVFGPGGLLLIEGTSTIDSEVTTAFMRMVDGTLAGSGNLHPTQFIFNNGTLARDLSLPNTATHTLESLNIDDGFALTIPSGSQTNVTTGTVSGMGDFVNEGTINKTGAGTETFDTFSNEASGLVQVQAGTLALTSVGTQEGTFDVSNGAILRFGGDEDSHTTLTTDTLVTGAGAINVGQGILDVPGGTANDYTGGTFVTVGGRVNLQGTGTGLSPAQVNVVAGVVSMNDPSNLLAGQALVQGGGTLAVRNEFIAQTQLAATSNGTFGIDIFDFDAVVDLAVLGNGNMSMGSTTNGSYTASTLGVGSGDTYRLGGGGGTITLTQQNVLTGDRALQIVGPGTVLLPEAQDFTQGTTVKSGTAALGSSASLGVGPLTFQGGGIRADGGPLTLNNDVTWAGNVTISGSEDLTLNGPSQLTGNRTLAVSNTGITTITQGITENAAGRRLTKDGPGTLVLGGDNSFTGGLTVRGGTLVVDSNQHYGGSTSVTLGSTMVLQGNLLGGGPVSVINSSTLTGEGTISGLTTIGNGSTLSPGFSPGTFAFGEGLALQNGSHLAWELATLSSSGSGGIDWDQLLVSDGELSISAGAKLDISFTGSATAPDLGDPFWLSTQRWHNVIDLTGDATNPSGFVDLQIDNSPWSQFGNFETLAAESGLGVDLLWQPVPEPSTWALMIFGAIGLWIARWLPRRRTTN